MVKSAETTKKENKFIPGLGRRKTAIAQVRLTAGKGIFTINSQQIDNPSPIILFPLVVTGQLGKFDVSAVVNGGGITGQAEAIRLGIARSLSQMDETYHSSLRKAGLLTRDPREKERKKPGLKRARKAPQWQKR
jgi:small subunit ribosomal protein S9